MREFFQSYVRATTLGPIVQGWLIDFNYKDIGSIDLIYRPNYRTFATQAYELDEISQTGLLPNNSLTKNGEKIASLRWPL